MDAWSTGGSHEQSNRQWEIQSDSEGNYRTSWFDCKNYIHILVVYGILIILNIRRNMCTWINIFPLDICTEYLKFRTSKCWTSLARSKAFLGMTMGKVFPCQSWENGSFQTRVYEKNSSWPNKHPSSSFHNLTSIFENICSQFFLWVECHSCLFLRRWQGQSQVDHWLCTRT